MALNFDVSPYYDDFDPTKNYYRILYKPGYAVQARELTQSQSILQDQVSKLGNGVFQDGSKVSGGNITIDTNIVTCKLTSDVSTYISSLTGLYAVGQTSGFVALVNSVDLSNYYIKTKPVNVANRKAFSSGETINFYVSKIDALNSLNSIIAPEYTATAKTTVNLTRTVTGTYLSYTLNVTSTAGVRVGDTVRISSVNYLGTVASIVDTSNITLSNSLTSDLSNISATITNEISVNALEVNVDDGVWFTNGIFVESYASSIVPDALNAYPSCVVGFEVDEYIVDSFSDPSLLDPAIGASNYQAPGADRYKISLNLVTKPYISDQVVTSLTTAKFIELVRVNAGVIEDINNVPILSDVSAAIATAVSDISGDFIVTPFSLTIGSAANNVSNTIISSISAGKAYIAGYPVQHISQTPYYLQKARSTNTLLSQDIETYYGDYTKVQNLNGSIINFQTATTVELHNVAFGAANTNTKIGTARVRNFSYDSGSLTAAQYKTFLYDIKLANNAFTNVASMIIPGAANSYSSVSFSANTVSPVTLVDNTYNSLIFPMPQTNISNVSSVNYVTTRLFTVPTFSSGVATITTNGTNETFVGGSGAISSAQRQINYFLVTTAASGSYANGQFIPMDQSNVSITITNSPGTPQAVVNIGGGFNGSALIYATISVVNDIARTKTLNQNYVVQTSANTYGQPIDLGVSDIYKFDGIYEMSNTYSYQGVYSNTTNYSANNAVLDPNGNVYVALANTNGNFPNTYISLWSPLTNNITFYSTDNGQRDTYYDHGKITNISGAARGNVVVVFDYFTHSGGTGYFDVNSYPVSYANIPSFTSPQYGSTYSLRDVIDFRPRRTDGASSVNTFQLPAPFNNVFLNYGYYLSRIDKIVLYPNGQFQTVAGVPAYTNPIAPSDVPGTLTVFTIYYPAYTYTKESIQVTPTNLRRYTMRDVGVLDKRISNLESYTSLSILENRVTGSDVTDSTGLNLLFKNGYLVDGFTGSSVADVKNKDYAASIDPVAQLARPSFFSNVAQYYVDTTQGTFVTSPGNKTNNQLSIANNIVTFSYNESSLVFQNVATEVTNVNPFNLVNFTGTITLSPSSDVWYSTQTQPNINIVTDDQAAWIAAVNGTGNGSQWNDWQLNWTGQSTDTVVTSADQTSITRDTSAITNAIITQGLTSSLRGGPVQVSSTTQILSNAVIPYARSIPINFIVNGMAPYTQIHTFLNGIIVDPFVTPAIGYTDSVNYINIVNAGSGYTNGNNQSIIQVIGANTLPAVFTANVSGGQIVAINYVQLGAGYHSVPTIQVTGSNTSTAILTANGAGYMGGNLVADINGHVEGTIQIPNTNGINIATGSILVEFADNFISPTISSVYAKTSFLSQGTLETTQTTVISTRPPIATPRPQVVDTGATYSSGGGTPVVVGGTTQTSTAPHTYLGSTATVGGTAAYTWTDQLAENYGWTVTQVNSGGPVTQDIANTVTMVDNTLGNKYGDSGIPVSVAAAAATAVAAYTASGISFDIANAQVQTYLNTHTAEQLAAAAAVINAATNDYSTTTSAATINLAGKTGNNICGAQDPLSQNFYVDSTKYPNGVFLSSVDLYFVTTDATLPVNVRIRPTVNGYPDSSNDIPGSIVWKNPDQINLPAANTITNSIGPATTITFDHPIYLQPGQYSIMIATNSNQYTLYASKLGQVQYGTNNVVNSLNYAASLFKSQNSQTWVAAPSETLCFNLKICDFAGGNQTFVVTSNTSSTAINFDLMHLITSDLSFSSFDSINYAVQTKDASTSALSTSTILEGQTYQFATRQIQNTSGDILIKPTVTNIDRWTSPVIDLERLNTVLIKNILTPYYSANTVSESLGGFGNGGASGRYITRRVTLNNNFASTGLTVFVDVNRQPGTSIEVYYKVLNQNDVNNFDLNAYVKMNPILIPGAGLPFTDATSYTSDTYQALNINYNDITTGTKYTNFNVFAIKVVFYSSNPAIAPQIKNFRAIATA